MRAKPMFLILIAAVCGLIASIGISQVMDSSSGARVEIPMEKIYVALEDIDLSTKLDEKHVRLEAWPKDKMPPGAMLKLEDLKDKYPKVRFFKGEPILAAKLMDSPGGINVLIPEGYRVVPVKVSAENAVGLITPGDRVDVLAFMRKSPDVPVTVTRTILTNVQVFAVGTETDRMVDKDGKQTNAQTVSLLVTPKQVQKILMAVELGRIQLSLRSGFEKSTKEDDAREDEGTNLSQFFQDDGEKTEKPEKSKAPVVAQKKNDFAAFLQQHQAAVKPTALPTIAEKSEAWTMEVHSPEGIRYLQWDSPQEPPREVAANDGAAKALVAQKAASDPRNLIGSQVDIQGALLKGGRLNWSEFRGKPVLVSFTATWCPSCVAETPLVKGLHDTYRSKGLEVVVVNLDKDPTLVSRFIVEHKLGWPTLFGPEAHQLAARLGVQSIPTLMLFDAHGRLNGVGHQVAEIAPQIGLMYGDPTAGDVAAGDATAGANPTQEEPTAPELSTAIQPPVDTAAPIREPAIDEDDEATTPKDKNETNSPRTE